MNIVLTLLVTHAVAFVAGALIVYLNFGRLQRELRRELEDARSVGRNIKDTINTILHD